MKLGHEMLISTTVRLRVGDKTYILSSVTEADKQLTGRTAIFLEAGEMYLGKIAKVDTDADDDDDLWYRAEYLTHNELVDEYHFWFTARNVLLLGENELERIKAANPEMFV